MALQSHINFLCNICCILINFLANICCVKKPSRVINKTYLLKVILILVYVVGSVN